jgi:hypothetical protein
VREGERGREWVREWVRERVDIRIFRQPRTPVLVIKLPSKPADQRMPIPGIGNLGIQNKAADANPRPRTPAITSHAMPERIPGHTRCWGGICV